MQCTIRQRRHFECNSLSQQTLPWQLIFVGIIHRTDARHANG